jgi:hypothetical protein
MFGRPFVSVLGGFTFLTILTGCAGGANGSSSMPLSAGVVQPQAASRSVDALTLQPPRSTSVLRPGSDVVSQPDRSAGFAQPDAAAKAFLIVSDAGTDDVDVFTSVGKLTATITGLSEPQGLSSDAAGDVYIANTGDSNIPVYKKDYKTLKATLNDPNEYPAAVDVSPAGLVGVTNIISTSDGSGSVSFYAKDTTKPCVTVAGSAWSRVYFGAFDAAGNFYIDGENSSGKVLLGVVAGGCSARSITTLKSTIRIDFPGFVAVSPADKLIIGDDVTLYTFDLPVKGLLGPPIAKTILKDAGDLTALAFTASGKDLWTISSQALEYAYPAGGSPVKRVSVAGLSEPIGLIVTPFAQP